MDIQNIRANLAQGKPTVGTWLQLPSADVAELMARAGYDWVAADMEHGSFGPGTLPNIFRAVECGGAVPFARLPEASRVWIKTALEAGAHGLIFPMIDNPEQLDQAIDLATYPGQDFWREHHDKKVAYRGVGYCRANVFGKNFEGYLQQTAPQIFIVAQIEHILGVENLDAILSRPRLDAIMVGPYDLSGSMGMTGQFGHPDFQKIMDMIARKCREHGKPMGLHIVQPDPGQLRSEIANGAKFIAYGIDTVFLWKSAERPDC